MIKDKVSLTIDRKVLEKVDQIMEELEMNRSEAINELLRDRLGMMSRFSEGILRKRDLLESWRERD